MAGGAVVHRYLPAVAFFTLPPHLFRASVGNGFRGKGKIGLTIPLGKQFCTAFRMAEGLSLIHIYRDRALMDNDYAAGDYAHDMEQETLYAQARTRLAQEDKP